VDALIDRADGEMLMVRAAHRSDWSRDDPSAWGDEAASERAG
jgi:hypothetical protein